MVDLPIFASIVHGMESTLRLEFKVGLLLIGGIIALVAVVLVSDRIAWEPRYRVTAYLPDADGLLVGSPVTMSGIRIGRVASIQPDTSGVSAIAVGMDIQERYTISQSAPLSLATAGILGDSYLAFAAPEDTNAPFLAKDGTAQVVGSLGFFAEVGDQARGVLGSVEQLLGPETQNDVQRLLNASANAMEETQQLLAGLNQRQQQFDQILNQIAGVLQRTDATLQQLDNGVVLGVNLLRDIGETLQVVQPTALTTIGDVQGLVQQLSRTAEGIDARLLDDEAHADGSLLGQTGRSLASLARMVEDLEQGRGVLGQILRSQALANDLNSISINLSNAAEAIADRPSMLVWGEKKAETAERRKARLSLQQRRAFMEGYMPLHDAQERAIGEPSDESQSNE
ncbi:MAG: MCE family protein [Planctomycetota bacterium]|nr:MAG: MCE family protein [Planctomycetota bacterium]